MSTHGCLNPSTFKHHLPKGTWSTNSITDKRYRYRNQMAKPMQTECLNLSCTRLHHVITQVIKYKKVQKLTTLTSNEHI